MNNLQCRKAYVHIEDWRNRPLQGGRYPYVYVDGIYLRRNWGGGAVKIYAQIYLQAPAE